MSDVIDTLAGIAARPVEPARIRAAFHQAAYHRLGTRPAILRVGSAQEFIEQK